MPSKRSTLALFARCWLILALPPSTEAAVPWLSRRGDCKTQAVDAGDSCGSLASKCGISSQDLTKYNPDATLCSKLAPGQVVCCSAGSLPDIAPKPGNDGTCATYVIKQGDSCDSITAANHLQTDDLSKFNDKITWGWSGCSSFQAGLTICLSTGAPPMPAPVPNAECGPMKSGSKRKGNESLATLNPCPLNACCTIWGQCGITPEYCTNELGPTQNPGTAPEGKNGCISNCGIDIRASDAPTTSYIVGYYESWNFDRPCLNMRAASLEGSNYTHVHWGFATVTKTFDIAINDTWNQWGNFSALAGPKKIVSIGGWGFSTDQSTNDILRQAMDPAHVETFIANIISFIDKNNLDGVDIDWEYPGAPDIPGIAAGLKSDAPYYLDFLTQLRAKLPRQKTVSIAAPASYWYLKQLPIDTMSLVVDYIVYMTYDLHGQWDYNDQWSQSGCAQGNCLRSHVNLTETNYALAMITKAGVSSNKIVVGVSSYGRSFGMTDAGCTGNTCTYGGPNSTAIPGECTTTAGVISNAEIGFIIEANDTGTTTWYDTESNSNILVYNETQWVAFMDDTTKGSRTGYYRDLHFLGTVDWALDLQAFNLEDEGNPNGDDDDDDLPPASPPDPCDATFNTMEDLDAAAASIPPDCQVVYALATLSTVLTSAVNSYNDMIKNGYDGKFQTYAGAVSDNAVDAVSDFMHNNGSSYFTCVIPETAFCCSQCSSQGGKNPCAYCFDGDCTHKTSKLRDLSAINATMSDLVQRSDRPGDAVSTVPNTRQANHSEPCPPDYSKLCLLDDAPPDKSDVFFADMHSETGIPREKIKFLPAYSRGNACAPSAAADDECWGRGIDYNFPQPNGYGTSDVSNPKDLVQKALDNSVNLQQQLQDALDDVTLYAYYGDATELVDSVSMPVLLIADAVDSMSQVEASADKIDEEKKKAIILAFISAILFLIPVAGEVAGSVAGATDVAAILAVTAVVGDTAFGIYSLVSDPDNPMLGIMSIVLAPLALTNIAKVSEASNLRREMSDADIAKLGGRIGPRMKTLQKVIGACKRSL